jgi:hypothetical protein
VAERFYETLALAAFALLGLWWVSSPSGVANGLCCHRRRRAYSVSLYFTLTGIMSLVPLISASHPALWRLAFGIAGVIGAAEVVLSLIRASSEPRRERRAQQLLAVTLPLYIIIVAIAIHPSLASDIGIHLKPLETEAIVVSLLLFLGINYGWLLFMEPPHSLDESES